MQALKQGQTKQFEIVCTKHPDRRLSATASGHVTTEPHKSGCPSQNWEKEGDDSSFSLKNKSTGTYLAYVHNKISLEKNPYLWAFDGELSQIYPKDDNYKALGLAHEDPRHVLVKEYLTDDEAQKWEWNAQPQVNYVLCLSARDLSITWGNDKRYWDWISQDDSCFGEIAKLCTVCWFEVRGELDSSLLSPCTSYTVSFILKLQDAYGWDNQPVKFEISTFSGHHQVSARFLQNRERPVNGFGYQMAPIRRQADGWIEIDAGEFVLGKNDVSGSKKVSFCMREWEELNWKGGLLLRGVKIQPKKRKE